LYKINTNDIYNLIIFFLLLILASARRRRWALSFAVKKKQKTSAENFSFEASGLAGAVEPEKFVRPISVERGYSAMV
jgi:hypothetical protein